jgi:hypothetical protein
MGKGLGPVQEQILGVATAVRDVLLHRGQDEDCPHYGPRLGLWAIYRQPMDAACRFPSTAPVRAARAALSRAARRLERRGLLRRYRGRHRVLTPAGEALGRGHAAAFRELVDLRALCGFKVIPDAEQVAEREWGCSVGELRIELARRVGKGRHPG